MARAHVVYIALCFLLVSVLLLIALARNCLDANEIIETPGIRRDKAVLTARGSVMINASVEEVFEALLDFKEYSQWSAFSEHQWQDTAKDGMPNIGSEGSLTLRLEGFTTRVIPIQLTVLDKEKMLIVEKSTLYPPWLLSTEIVQQVLPIKGQTGACEYRTWQTMEGVAAYYLLLTELEDLIDCHKGCANALKTYVERKKSDKSSKVVVPKMPNS